MSLSISQAISVSYPEVMSSDPADQFSESALLREFDRLGYIQRVNGAPTYEDPLDYRANAGAGFDATDLAGVSTSKTDVLTSASYTSAQLSVPIVWSKKDEAENSDSNRKVPFVASLVSNAKTSHDDVIENALFDTSTNGFLGLATMVPTTGQPNVGGIDGATYTWWRNGADTAGVSTLLAKTTAMWNTLTKGSGSSMTPKSIVSDAATQAVYEATQQAFVRYMSTDEANAGFKVIAFKTARWVFSQYGDGHIYFLNPKSFRLAVVKQAYRLLGDTIEFDDAQGYIRKIFTLAFTKINNMSRLGVITYS